jgi:hypothetical protein
MQVFYIIVYANHMDMPHRFRANRRMELFNEAMLLGLFYQTVFISRDFLTIEQQVFVSYSFLGLLGFTIFVNLVFIFAPMIETFIIRLIRRIQSRQTEKDIN